jgi:transposase
LLMPPSLTEWLPEDHLVWTVLGAVDQMDLSRFTQAYRLGAAGRARLDPAMMVALLLYAYARGIRSSRGIERACWEDVAFKVITGMRTPDHSTIAEFRRRHEAEIAGLFDEVLGLCREAGLVSVGVITIDGTKLKANASMDQNRGYRELVTEILCEAEEPTSARTSSTASSVAMSSRSSSELRRVAGRRWRTRSVGSPSARGDRPMRNPSRRWRSISSRRCSLGRCSGVAAGGNGCGWRAANWTRTEPARHGRSRVIATIVCLRRLSGLRRTSGSTWLPTRPMSGGGRPRGTRRVGC